jgi:hypothetical protein
VSVVILVIFNEHVLAGLFGEVDLDLVLLLVICLELLVGFLVLMIGGEILLYFLFDGLELGFMVFFSDHLYFLFV